MDQSEITEGKKRVRAHLIAPLEADGMARVAKSAADHDAFLARIEAALCYLGEAELISLAETCARGAVACKKCRAKAGWPALVAIRNWAHDIRPRPPGYSPKVKSWMASAAGQRAWTEDQTVAAMALRYLVRFAGVPGDDNGGMRTVRGWAEDLRRDLARARDLLDNGTGGDPERALLARHAIEVDRARALVNPEQTSAGCADAA